MNVEQDKELDFLNNQIRDYDNQTLRINLPKAEAKKKLSQSVLPLSKVMRANKKGNKLKYRKRTSED